MILSELRIGWKRFFNGSVSDSVIGLVAADFIPPKRADLGDIDQSLWETESNGSRKDPWVLGYEVPMVALADDELFTSSPRAEAATRRSATCAPNICSRRTCIRRSA